MKRLELRVPELKSGYDRLGQRWANLKPTDIASAALEVLQRVVELPQEKSSVARAVGVDELHGL